MSKYFNYLRIKQDLPKVVYRGYRLRDLLSFQIAEYCYSDAKFKVLLHQLLRVFVVKNVSRHYQNLELVEQSIATIFSIDSNRPSYNELFQSVLGLQKDSSSYMVSQFKNLGPSLCFRWKNVLFAIREVFNCGGVEFSRFRDKLFYLSILIRLLNQIDNIEKINFPRSVQKYVAFNSSVGVESIMTMFCKKNGIDTYSLQHGIYYQFSDPVPMDIINYESVLADRLLCWGEYSKNEMVKYGIFESKLCIAGNPLFLPINTYKKRDSYSSVIVFTARSFYSEGNTKLLNILLMLPQSYTISIKCHPSDKLFDPNMISSGNITRIDDGSTSKQLLQSGKYDFAITYNTTVYYEAISEGILCLAFGWGEDGAEVMDSFITLEEFEGILAEYKKGDAERVALKFKNFSEYVFGKESDLLEYQL